MNAAASSNKNNPGSLLENMPLARYTTWRVGGPAKRLYLPESLDDLIAFLQKNPEGDLTWLGLGSNTLIRDGGIDDIVILTHRGLMDFDQRDSDLVYVGAGVPCAKVARHTARLGLTSGEFFAGIPGTIGGALAMNAGCHQEETWPHVVSVTTINRQGHVQQRSPHEYQIGYRSVQGPIQEWFVGCELRFTPSDAQSALARINKLLAHRTATQPTSEYNAGSVFRNPPDDYAARLIQELGLKGHTLGDACISEKHANFIINLGHASASDIEALINYVQDIVHERFGILLEREIRILGRPLPA